MTDKFFSAHEFTARWEGGISNHPADKGKITAYGASFRFVHNISSTCKGTAFLESIHVPLPVTKSSMRNITPLQAKAMFHFVFWEPLRLDDLPQRVATCIYDMAVNSGPVRSVKCAQQGYNRCIIYGIRLVEDGILGPLTRRALQQDTNVIIRTIIDVREEYYNDIVDRDPSQAVFLKGWMNRLNGLRTYLRVK